MNVDNGSLNRWHDTRRWLRAGLLPIVTGGAVLGFAAIDQWPQKYIGIAIGILGIAIGCLVMFVGWRVRRRKP
jgi:hypothetical protein